VMEASGRPVWGTLVYGGLREATLCQWNFLLEISEARQI
jgi:hypothetical protein